MPVFQPAAYSPILSIDLPQVLNIIHKAFINYLNLFVNLGLYFLWYNLKLGFLNIRIGICLDFIKYYQIFSTVITLLTLIPSMLWFHFIDLHRQVIVRISIFTHSIWKYRANMSNLIHSFPMVKPLFDSKAYQLVSEFS